MLPSMEAFEMGVELPGVHFIFYEFFFKSSVGDSAWRSACKKSGPDLTSPLGNAQDESFALVLLKNNYFAWLLDAKLKHPELVTDYDQENRRLGKKCLPEVFLRGWEINLSSEGNELDNLLVNEGNEDNEVIKTASEEAYKNARARSRNSDTYRKMKRALEFLHDLNNGHETEDESTHNNGNALQREAERRNAYEK